MIEEQSEVIESFGLSVSISRRCGQVGLLAGGWYNCKCPGQSLVPKLKIDVDVVVEEISFTNCTEMRGGCSYTLFGFTVLENESTLDLFSLISKIKIQKSIEHVK